MIKNAICVTCTSNVNLNLNFLYANWKVCNRFCTFDNLMFIFFYRKSRQPLQSEPSTDDTTLAMILGVAIGLSTPACLLSILVFYVIRKGECIYLSIILLQYINLTHFFGDGHFVFCVIRKSICLVFFNQWCPSCCPLCV